MQKGIEVHDLITRKEAVKELGFVSYDGLYRGSRGTHVLTRFPHGLYSRQECQALKAAIIAEGLAKAGRKPRKQYRPRKFAEPETKELTI